MKILVLGASGMLGNTVIRELSKDNNLDVFGTVRSKNSFKYFSNEISKKLIHSINVENVDSLFQVINKIKPNLLINCIGLVKQLGASENPLQAIPINSLLPHRLAQISSLFGARLIQISTDCVFTGSRGNYLESDAADAQDLYGRSKCLGEVNYPNAITLRTSIIGHELDSSHSLLGWFLAQKDPIKGYRKALFSGLPTIEVARIIRDHVIPNPHLTGLYHLSADPISKYDLLRLIATQYSKEVDIQPDDSVIIDRTLDSTRFRCATGYTPGTWTHLIKEMYKFG